MVLSLPARSKRTDERARGCLTRVGTGRVSPRQAVPYVALALGPPQGLKEAMCAKRAALPVRCRPDFLRSKKATANGAFSLATVLFVCYALRGLGVALVGWA